MRKTKIIATLGPSSSKWEVIKDMIDAGLDCARINFSHGDKKSWTRLIEQIKIARQKSGKDIPIIMDSKGPEIRIGNLKDDMLKVKNGDIIKVIGNKSTANEKKSDAKTLYINHNNIHYHLKKGAVILIDDAKISAKVVESNKDFAKIKILNDGTISSRKRFSAPTSELNLEPISKEDLEDIEFALKHDLDYIALSFVRNTKPIIATKELARKYKKDIKIISKIEDEMGLKNLKEIAELSDGLMVARGDLGVEIPYEKVPLAQEEIIEVANQKNKVVIVATHLLESMKDNLKPTRAEVSDVWNAVKSHAGAIMLSGETASGSHPVESIKVMSKIAKESEASNNYFKYHIESEDYDVKDLEYSACYGAIYSAYKSGAKAIVVYTTSGKTAQIISALRPSMPIIAHTTSNDILRQMHLLWGVFPVIGKGGKDMEELFSNATKHSKDIVSIKKDDIIVCVAGKNVGKSGTTNTIRIIKA